jgi:hypothetical protein
VRLIPQTRRSFISPGSLQAPGAIIPTVGDRDYSTMMQRYPEINRPAVLLLFCLAPHGVFPAARITPCPVSSYLAFSPLPSLLPKNRRCFFCDTFRRRNFATAAPACFTRHAAVWCSDFPPANLRLAGDRLPSRSFYLLPAEKQLLGTRSSVPLTTEATARSSEKLRS